ncbi:MAG: hypothetical protein ACKV2T_32485 [Kofleriaceae bacterium]
MKQFVVCAALIAATSSVALAGDGTNLTKYVADTTSVYFVMDVAGAKSSALVKESFAKLMDAKPEARQKLEQVGLDPLRDLDTMVVAFGGFTEIENLGEGSSMVMIFEGRLPKDARAKFTDAVRTSQKGVDVFSKDDHEMSIIDGRLFLTQKGGMSNVIAFAKGKSRASLATGPGGKEMRETIKTASTKSHVWGAVVLPQKDRAKTVAAQMPVNAASFGFKFSSNLDGGLRIVAPSEVSAEGTLKMLTGALPQVKMMMGTIGLDVAANTLKLGQDKSAVTASIKLTETEIKSLFAKAMAQSGGASPAPKPVPPPQAPPTKGGLGKKP